jgi:hypothetical protein
MKPAGQEHKGGRPSYFYIYTIKRAKKPEKKPARHIGAVLSAKRRFFICFSAVEALRNRKTEFFRKFEDERKKGSVMKVPYMH